MNPVHLVVHGHFYQPPRDNPWTDAVPREPSAAPFHDWNARIHAECYRANAYARIYGPDDRIRAMVNNYERLSFNFGPTLARWMARHDPRTAARVRAGDEDQRRRLGAGGAIAQVWSHPIVPLLSPADRRTQIAWGLHDFRRRFGRDADGIWLPETAVDAPTLEALIDAGVRYTILAPEQIAAVRPPGGAWTEVTRETLDTGRAYLWRSSDRPERTITLAVFDGALSRELAFGQALRDAGSFIHRVKTAAERSRAEGPRLVLAASDGELYGHHRKFADLTLAYATTIEAPAQEVEVTNLGAFLAAAPATWEAELVRGAHGEGTAWSCAHGLGRWRRHCGCAMRPPGDTGWSQAWRGPLREALDLLRDRAARFFADAGGDLFTDPAAARDAYGTVVDDPVAARTRLLREHGRPALRRGDARLLRRAHGLMEMQRATLLMYASCGWFFDDIAGLESGIVLRQAAHAMDLWRALGGRPPEDDVLGVLATARSNQPGMGSGADVFRRLEAHRITPAHAVAQAAFHALARQGAAGPARVPGFDVALGAAGDERALAGQARVVHERSGEEARVAFRASYDGVARFECRAGRTVLRLEDLDDAAARPLRLAALKQIAARPATLASCRDALALAEALGGAGPREAERIQTLLAELLLGLLQAHPPARLDAAVLAVADELVEACDLPSRDDEAHLVEDMIWEALAHFRGRRRGPPRALRALADRLRLAPEAVPAPGGGAP